MRRVPPRSASARCPAGWVGWSARRSTRRPAAEGPPAVFDSALGADRGPPTALAAMAAPWAVLAPEGGWLIVALAVAAMEPLATFHARLDAALAGQAEGPGRLLPAPWQRRR